MNKKAFTLAEVLITLGIIGLIASMTMPQLIKKYQEKVLLQQGKKTYTTLANALIAYSNDIGTPEEYALIFDGSTNINDIVNNFAKYLKVTKICTTVTTDCGGTYDVQMQYYNRLQTTSVMNKYNRIVLNDGAFIAVVKDNTSSGTCYYTWNNYIVDDEGYATGEVKTATSTRCGRIYFDVNGLKGPNFYGKDIFEIEIFAKKIKAEDSLNSSNTKGFDNAIINDSL